jgi:phage terminase large subunit-like protein
MTEIATKTMKTEKIKLRLSDLEKMSQQELLAIATQTKKISKAALSNRQEVYRDNMHAGQLEAHKDLHRILYVFAGNRCLSAESRLLTPDGYRAIADISHDFFVLSWDSLESRARFVPATAPFPKAKGSLYRVVHELGEFVASGHHRLLCADGVYRSVESLGHESSHLLRSAVVDGEFLARSIEELSPRALPLNAPSFLRTREGLTGHYEGGSHQHDRQPLRGSEISRAIFQQSADAQGCFPSDDSLVFGHKDALADSARARIRPDQETARPCRIYLDGREVARFESESESRVAFEDVERSSLVSPESARSLQMCEPRHRDFLNQQEFAPSTLDAYPYSPYSQEIAPGSIVSKVLRIEKLTREDWYWDTIVPETNNYFAEGCFHHNSGKTSFGINELIWSCTGEHPFKRTKVPIKSAVVLQDFENHGKKIFEPKLYEWVDPKKIERVERNQTGAITKITWKTGSITDVYSHDQALKVFEGSDYDVVWFDEPPPRRIWVAMWRGCTDRGGRMYFTGTPLESPWLYKEYNRIKDGSDPVSGVVIFPAYINAKNLGEGDEKLGRKRLDELASQYSAEERIARIDGGFLQLQGVVFKDWNPSVHLIKPFPIPHSWPVYESIDPHPRKPWAVTWTAHTPNGSKILLRGCYFDGDIEDVANQILLARSDLIEVVGGLRMNLHKTLIDNASSVPTWQRSHLDPTARRVSVREELEKYIGPSQGGPRVTVAPKNVSGKIALFKRWLKVRERGGAERPDFYVFDNEDAENFVNEIEGYIWDRKKKTDDQDFKDQPVKKNDDILDSVMQVALVLGDTPSEEPEIIEFSGGFETYGIRGR